MDVTYIACAAILGYLLGSVPFGLVLTRMAGLGDIRKIGSGNIGATNVLRTGNKPLALATLLLDSGKGAIAVLSASYIENHLGLNLYLGYIAGGCAFLGHLYSIFLKFTGGKGVATFLGTLIALHPLTGISTALLWAISAGIFRISSLSALIASLSAPIIGYFLIGIELAILSSMLCILIFYKHRDNISRILKGTEPKIGKSKKG